MVHDSSSWTVISFIAEGQPEDISMMEILNTWLDAKVLHAKKNNIYKYGNCFIISYIDFVRPATSN